MALVVRWHKFYRPAPGAAPVEIPGSPFTSQVAADSAARAYEAAHPGHGGGFTEERTLDEPGAPPPPPPPPPPPSAPVFTSGPLPQATVGATFTGQLTASNTTSYAVTSGVLPAGLSLNGATGALTGTPSVAGHTALDVTATGPGGTAVLSFVLTVNPVVPNPPPPPPVGKQPFVVWTGIGEWNNLETGVGGVSFASLVQAGFHEIVVIQNYDDPLPQWLKDWESAISHTGLWVRPGFYGASQPPALSPPVDAANQAVFLHRLDVAIEQAVACGSLRVAVDLEPTGTGDAAWLGSDHAGMKAFGVQIGQKLKAAGCHMLCYTSTGVSWDGSFNDKLEQDAGNGRLFVNCLFPDMVDGILAAGGAFTYADSCFYNSGVNFGGRTWASAAAESVRLATARFPGITASIMPWLDEHGPIANASGILQAALATATGPIPVYQQHLTDAGGNLWAGGLLAAIKAATGA